MGIGDESVFKPNLEILWEFFAKGTLYSIILSGFMQKKTKRLYKWCLIL